MTLYTLLCMMTDDDIYTREIPFLWMTSRFTKCPSIWGANELYSQEASTGAKSDIYDCLANTVNDYRTSTKRHKVSQIPLPFLGSPRFPDKGLRRRSFHANNNLSSWATSAVYANVERVV